MAQEGERFNTERAANAAGDAREAADRAKWDAAWSLSGQLLRRRTHERRPIGLSGTPHGSLSGQPMLGRRHERRPIGLSGTPRVAERAAAAAAEAREAATEAERAAEAALTTDAERATAAAAEAREAADRAAELAAEADAGEPGSASY